MCSPEIEEADLIDLLGAFAKKAFDACELGPLDKLTMSKCEMLLKLDYSVIELDNANGMHSARYPERIFIPEYEHGHMSATITASTANVLRSCSSTSGFESENGYGSSAERNGSFSSSSITQERNGGVTFNKSMDQVDNVSAVTTTAIPNGYARNLPQEHNKDIIDAEMTEKYNMMNGIKSNCNNNTQSSNGQTANKIMREDYSYIRQNQPPQRTIYEDLYDINRIRELIIFAKYARCRQRFVVPVIMFRGKFICRSATLSVVHEAYGRYAFDYFNGTNTAERAMLNEDDITDPTDESLMSTINEPSPFSYDEVIRNDVLLMNALNVNTIVDLMVEKRKIKYFMPVSSSEKADPAKHYEKFNILALPYPGCEFFKKFRDNNYMARELYYNWNQAFNDANISIPKTGPATDLDTNWDEYRDWDLVQITQNYLKAMLKYVKEENSGLLVHCISGWDRTPLFISLLRLSLWADGLIHQSLNPMQITYLTLAYDWYLFGHQLPDRLKRGEEIMFFCFHVLKFLFDEQFSLMEPRKRTKTCSSSGGSSVIILKQDDEVPLRDDFFLTTCDQDSNDSFSNISNCDMSITETFYAMTTPGATTATNNALTSRSPNSKRSRTSPISVPGMSATRQRQESTSSNGSWQVVTDTGSIDSVLNGSYMKLFGEHRSENNSVQSGNSISMGIGNVFGGGSSGHVNSAAHSNHYYSSSSTSSNNSNGSNDSKSAYKGAVGFSYPTTNNLAHTMVASSLTTTTEETETAATGELAAEEAAIASRSRTPPTLREQRLNAVRAAFIRAYGKAIGLKFKEGSSMNIATLIGTLF